MSLESGTFVSDLDASNPTSSDLRQQGDDHLRLIKSLLKATFPNADHAIYLEQARADLASATTPDLGAQTTDYINITGTTTITGFGTVAAGVTKLVRFAAALTLTYNVTSLIIPGDANITTAADDHMLVRSLGAGNWRVLWYSKADGTALVGGLLASNNLSDLDDASTARTNLGVAIGSDVQAFDADTAKLDTAQEWTGAQNFNETALTSTSNSVAWDAGANQVATHTLTENTTVAAPTNIPAGRMIALRVIQHASAAKTLAWNAVFKWPGGTTPTMSTGVNDIDIYTFWSDGTNLHSIGISQDIS